jgi:hypothetical protein
MCKQIPEFKSIIENYSKLNDLYNKVKIEYIQGEPTTKVVDGQLVIEDSSTSKIIMTDAQLSEITNLVEDVRKELLK